MLLFILFVVIAAVFWFIMALNDSVEETFTVRLNIYNKPDSVTFISDVPQQLTVTVRDKGTQLVRFGIAEKKVMDINFREYAADGCLRCSNKEIYRLLRNDFGAGTQILGCSLDSIRLVYTTLPGRRVPVTVVSDVSAALGKVVGTVTPSERSVLVYSDNQSILDTIFRVYTQKIVRKGLKETTKARVNIAPLRNVRVIPSSVMVNIPVEALVSQHTMVSVTPVNVPAGNNLLLFPSSVDVNYYVPMGKVNNTESDIRIVADYLDIGSRGSRRIALRVAGHPKYMTNITLKTDSVEYTVVKNN